MLVMLITVSFASSAFADSGWHNVTHNNVNYRQAPSTSSPSYGQLNEVDDHQVYPTWVYLGGSLSHELFFGNGLTWVKCWEATGINHIGYIVTIYVDGF